MDERTKPGTKAFQWQLIHLAHVKPLANVDDLAAATRKSKARILIVTLPEYISEALRKASYEYRMNPDTETDVEVDIALTGIERWLVQHKQLKKEDAITGEPERIL